MEWMKEAVDYVIFGILGLMGFVALWLTIERMLFLKRYRPADYASEEERGIALTKACRAKLDRAEERIRKLDEEGKLSPVKASDLRPDSASRAEPAASAAASPAASDDFGDVPF